ncbi:UDP-N-acetylmuramoyl-tripeptide--D-alanyl-D-alanine ligase [Youhaiella tibetensis]|uniref:UDP-N-acetylmuramoyl-tripeptide--D-alanyl-D-alanine ligase n=1 Tax=Paradevosia tibetensis TaxID=1447062 RepID=A0A5B9DST1_9HYPH|nr:UDP-N-acetylmuramoyl-tripeptide--D-alanyl-D-alanine ligase [Youhaiella tibetensis]QEE21404.1 UDP-N-acetylmuramoyl-tripeptide--D-alanyl-D-alanine ligase [Youhaiella tibetensis]GGF15319.1 UDP-N-acetylmuramoyl-tripeptide--D-alanyl-D-alanine ligase [Youhaiella tibetensis]
MASLFTVGEILAATEGRAEGLTADGVSSISIDSREIGPDALFVAIKGDRFDGHDFVGTALANGARAALVSADKAGALEGALVVVPDALEGLRNLARAARARSNARIVAVTGSAGKTTTKEAIRTVLGAAAPTHFSIKSFNNHWGVPLMLARMPREAQFGVFELGMNHAGEISPLTRLVRPHVAVVTTVAAAHLEFFDSIEGIARAKAEIFEGLEPGGVAVINADHDHAGLLVEMARASGAGKVVTYGFAEGADWRIERAEAADGHMHAVVRHGGATIPLSIKAQGRHMVANAVAALVVAEEFGVNRDAAVSALAQFGAPEGRGETSRLGPPAKPLLLIDESYNANSASMAAAMDVFAGQSAAPGGRKVLVLGDMLELGEKGPALHAALKDAVLASGADAVYLVGSSMAALADALGPQAVTDHKFTTDEIAQSVLAGLAYGDAVMVKGSNGVRLSGLVKQIRERFA